MNLQQINSKADETIALVNQARDIITEELKNLESMGIETLEIGLDSVNDDSDIITEITLVQINDREYYNDEIDNCGSLEDLFELEFDPITATAVKNICNAIILLFHGENNQLFKLI